jgi:hypothetical protein
MDLVVNDIGVISAMAQQSPDRFEHCDTAAIWQIEGCYGVLAFFLFWDCAGTGTSIYVDYDLESEHCEHSRALLDVFLEHFALTEHPEDQATVLEQITFNTMH